MLPSSSATVAASAPPRRPAAGTAARHAATAVGSFALLAVVAWFLPKWLIFLLTMAAANGLVSLGIVGLMRGGVVSFGQGMVFAIGGYAAALLYNRLGFTDAIGLALAGGLAALLAAAGPEQVRLDHRLRSVTERPEGVRLDFADRPGHDADVLIGADGIHSVVRAAVHPDVPVFSGLGVFRGLVPTALLPRAAREPVVRLPPVRQECRVRLRGPADADDLRAAAERGGDERRPGEATAADD